MTYAEAIDYLYNQLPMFSRIGAAAVKKDLTNTIELCEWLNNPQKNFKSIHIAGTNGKGSVSHMVAAVLQTAGYKTGLYTSPHLKDFRERIKFNGKMCTEDFVVQFVEKVKPLAEKIKPSFFEITVAMAFDYFAQNNVETAVIETGLGGRLDSTNIIKPSLSVITNIGWDHMNMLGNSLKEIAIEKAGIIKPNVPVIIGESQSETNSVFIETAEKYRSNIFFADKQRYVSDWQHQSNHLNITVVESSTDSHETYALDLLGIYQTKNILTVLEVINRLNATDWNISNDDLKKGLSKTKQLTGLHGRWEIINQKPLVILDVAHNVNGIEMLAEHLELLSYDHLYLIIGLVKDKDAEKIFELLPKYASYLFTKAQIPRALPENELAEKASVFGLKGNIFPDVNAALQNALQHAGEKDVILICGSIYLVAEVNFKS